MNIPESHIEDICGRKHPYSSQKDAEFKIRSMRKKGKIISPLMKIYKCHFCDYFHIGRQGKNY